MEGGGSSSSSSSSSGGFNSGRGNGSGSRWRCTAGFRCLLRESLPGCFAFLEVEGDKKHREGRRSRTEGSTSTKRCGEKESQKAAAEQSRAVCSMQAKPAARSPALPSLREACSVAAQGRRALWGRAAAVSGKLVPVAVCCCVDFALPGGPRWAVANARRLRLALEALGPAFVKLGQAVAAREDILHPDVAAELRRLCDQVAPFASEEAKKVLLQELGENAPAIPDKPVAAASLGQVYKIQVGGGKSVALKIQRPGLADGLAVDVLILKSLARTFNRLLRRFCASGIDLTEVVQNWALTLWQELDYMHEAETMEDMQKSLRRCVPGLVIPDVHWELTSTRVLATSWIDGAKVSECPSTITEKHVRVGVETFAAMVLDLGVVHADPHAGNLLVTPADELVLLDFGMVIRVPEAHRIAWAWCFVSIVRGDYEKTLDSLIEIGFFPRTCNRQEVLPVMSKIWWQLVASGSSTQKRREAVMQLSGEILTLVRRFEYNLPDYYVALLRALLTLEGLALCADRDFDLFKVVFPVALRRVAVTASNTAAQSARALLPLRLRRCSTVVLLLLSLLALVVFFAGIAYWYRALLVRHFQPILPAP